MFESDLLHPAKAAPVFAATAWSKYVPDGLLADMLSEQVGGSDFERLERIGAWEKVIAWAQASQAREIATYVGGSTEAAESATAEVGLMLRVAAPTTPRRSTLRRGQVRPAPATSARSAGRIISSSSGLAGA